MPNTVNHDLQFTDEELAATLKVLQAVADNPAQMDAHERFKALVAKVHKNGKRGQRLAANSVARTRSQQVRLQTGMVNAQLPGGTRPQLLEYGLTDAGQTPVGVVQHCYVCKSPYYAVHSFYHLLCPVCAGKNWDKRQQRADLSGRVALVTGGRIKIGYALALRLLRDGARVIVTTRFPQDARKRFYQEADAPRWIERLSIEALDLRNLPSVQAFAQQLCECESHLDIVVNNAAQTIKRPQSFYAQLMAREPTPWLLEANRNYLGQLPGFDLRVDNDALDRYGQPLDKRPNNSWSLRLHEVSMLELLEVQLVNALAPFLLTAQLKPALLRSPHARRFVVQASAMEGQFNRSSKTQYHPHTNMAKASLNMLVRTSAQDWANDHIYMNAVDTGWITNENPFDKAVHMEQTQHFYTPLDVVDGMARLYDPIARGVNEADTPLFGHFLKDYEPYPW